MSHNTSYCLTEVVTKAGLTISMHNFVMEAKYQNIPNQDVFMVIVLEEYIRQTCFPSKMADGQKSSFMVFYYCESNCLDTSPTYMYTFLAGTYSSSNFTTSIH